MTSTGVSLAHGSNDGQKGVGLVMIILIGCLPAHFALNLEYGTKSWDQAIHSLEQMATVIQYKNGHMLVQASYAGIRCEGSESSFLLRVGSIQFVRNLIILPGAWMSISLRHPWNPEKRLQLRKYILLLEDEIKSMERSEMLQLTSAEKEIVT